MCVSLRILKTLCRKLKLSEDFDHQQLARLTPGYVGADLMALCREAAMNAVNRVLITLGGCPSNSSQAFTEHLSTAGRETEPETRTDNDGAERRTADANLGAPTPSAPEHPQVRPPPAEVCEHTLGTRSNYETAWSSWVHRLWCPTLSQDRSS